MHQTLDSTHTGRNAPALRTLHCTRPRLAHRVASQLWQSLGYVFIFLLGPRLTFVHLAFAAAAFAIISCVTVVVLDAIHPLSKSSK